MIQWCTSCLNLPCSFWAHHAWIILYIIVYYLYCCFPETVVRRTVRPTGVLSVRWCEGHAHMTYLHMCRDRTAMQGSFPGTITCARLSWHITQESLFTVPADRERATTTPGRLPVFRCVYPALLAYMKAVREAKKLGHPCSYPQVVKDYQSQSVSVSVYSWAAANKVCSRKCWMSLKSLSMTIIEAFASAKCFRD